MRKSDEEVSKFVELVRGISCDAGVVCSNALLVQQQGDVF